MRVLVTGATGFIGSHLVEELNARGIQPEILIRKSSSLKNLSSCSAHHLIGDLSHPESLPELGGYDLVFHLAAAVTAPDLKSFERVNSQGTAELVRKITVNGSQPRIVLMSSLAAGGPSCLTDPRQETEHDEPVSDYGKSKKLAEELLKKNAQSLELTIIRPPIVYGPRDSAFFQVIRMCQGFIAPVVSANNGTSKYYSSVFVKDLVQATCELGLRKTQNISQQTYYVSSSEILAYEAMLDIISKQLKNKPIKKIKLPTVGLRVIKTVLKACGGRVPFESLSMLSLDKIKELEQDAWLCSPQKLERETGFRCGTGFSEGISKSISWYKQEGWL